MKKKFIKTPLKGVYVHGAKDVGTRTVNLLMGEHAGEYVRGDIMDANAVIQAFDELKGNVDSEHDSLEEVVDELHNLRDATDQSFEVFQEKAEEETANRIQGDKTLDEKIDQKERESKERDNTLQQNIDTEKQERVNADTQLRNDLTAEVNRAKARENALDSDIQAEATKRENDDNTIKDNLNAEVTRATAKENEIKAEVDVINGDSTTEGSFRKAIADVVGAAPEAYDTLKEIADKLNENDDLHAAINDAIATKATTVALNEEITRAKAAEAENKAEIAAEAARAKKAEGDNALAIQNEESRARLAETTTNEALNTEIDRAKGQEAYLQNLVNTKADTTALEGAKTELDNKLAQKADTTTLNEQVDALNTAISAKVDSTAFSQSLSGAYNDLNNKITNNTQNINSAANYLSQELAGKQEKGNYIQYDPSVTNSYQIDRDLSVKESDGSTATFGLGKWIDISNGNRKLQINYSSIAIKSAFGSFKMNPSIRGLEFFGTGDNKDGLKLCTNRLSIGKETDINADNGEMISISREHNTLPYIFKVKDNSIETNELRLNELGLTNYKSYSQNGDVLFVRHSAMNGAILVEDNSDLSIGDDRRIRTRPYWKFGFYGADFNGSDSKNRIHVNTGNGEYANIFGIKLTNNVFDSSSFINDPCEIQNNSDYVSFSKKIKVSDIITDATTDSSLNSVLSKKVDTGAFNSFVSSVNGQFGSFNGTLSNFGGQIALKQDKITPTTELDLTSIDTADIESLRSIVKALATELNTLGLIKLKSAEETV